MAKGSTYNERWRDRVREGAQRSAVVLADLIIDEFDATDGWDVGCGEGWLGAELKTRGVHIDGIDGPWVTNAALTVDLEKDAYPALEQRGLVICLETAEHVPQERAGDLVAWLCSLGDVVVFSAAVPGQGGEGHVNEQWPAYWVDRFEANGYFGTGIYRWDLWANEEVCWWYAQNLLVFSPTITSAAPSDDPRLAVVHPGAWSHHGHG